MRGVLKWSGLVLAGLVGLALLLYVLSRLMPIPVDEARALALLDAPRELEGRNGFAALWALGHEVPDHELERVLADDVRRFGDTKPSNEAESQKPFVSGLDRYASLDSGRRDEAPPCNLHEGRCLDQLRSSPDSYAAVRDVRKRLSARIANLDDYDYFRSPFPPRFDTPFPGYQALSGDLTVHADAFVQGDTANALAGVCRGASISRKLVASGDNLIGSMMGVALMKGYSGLFVEMLGELPADYPLPSQCMKAFSPDGALNAGVCQAMIGEGRYVTGGLRSMNIQRPQEWHAPMTLDLEKTAAINASRFAWFCGTEAAQMLRRDEPLIDPRPHSVRWSLRCVANAAGCILADIAAPAYRDYSLRLQDAEARQKLVSTWLWLRENPDRSRTLAERLAGRPDAFKSPGREIEIVDDGRALQMRMYETRREGSWQLALPEWLRDAPPG